MIETQVLIIGGGPAGAACAWRLRQNQVPCIVLDRQPFPRFKPCAGWITPQVLRYLGIEPGEYPRGLTHFTSFNISIRGLKFKLRTNQYAIRRFEFDDWLLTRAGVEFQVHHVETIHRDGDGFVVDDQYTARYVVGAGGTHCPVYRTFFQEHPPASRGALIVGLEEEFPLRNSSPACHLWFLENQLPGYAWYVPKTGGFVNVGIGASAARLKASRDTLRRHWDLLLKKLDTMALVRGHDFKPVGHSYHLRRAGTRLRHGNAFVVGDAAGLATLDIGEGIGPAIQSGLQAAGAILGGGEVSAASIPRYSFPSLLGFRR